MREWLGGTSWFPCLWFPQAACVPWVVEAPFEQPKPLVNQRLKDYLSVLDVIYLTYTWAYLQLSEWRGQKLQVRNSWKAGELTWRCFSNIAFQWFQCAPTPIPAYKYRHNLANSRIASQNVPLPSFVSWPQYGAYQYNSGRQMMWSHRRFICTLP